MEKNGLFLLFLPLLLTSCVIGESSSASTESSEISLSSSFTFGSDPTSAYQRENTNLISTPSQKTYHVQELLENGSKFLWGPSISLAFGDSWVDVKLDGQKDITSGVKGFNSLIINHGYNDGTNDIYLDGREFPGVDGEWDLNVYIPENACRNPDECFVRLVSHPKDNLDVINGYALAVAYPVGNPVEVTSEEAGFSSEELAGKTPGLVWLNWKTEAVGDGVSFPKVNGEYQNIDINRVNAALDIMETSAEGHYFNKSQNQTV